MLRLGGKEIHYHTYKSNLHHAHTPWPIKFVFLSLPFSFSCVCVLTKDASTYLRFTLRGTSRSNGNGVGELIYALSSLFITANAYYDIQVTFQTVSMQISGGLVELLYGSVWMDGDIQLNSGKVPPQSLAQTPRFLVLFMAKPLPLSVSLALFAAALPHA